MYARRILVPLDGSALAERVLPHVIELARHSEARIDLLRTASGHGETESVTACEAYLGGVAERLGAEGVGNVRTSVWEGDPVGAILKAARFRKVDLIVMTTHGRSGLGRLAVGSVAEAVLRRTRTPVLVIPRPDAPPDRSTEPDAQPAEPR